MLSKGIILAGGSGSRLYPITASYSKQLAAVYDKPLIYYPLNTLISLGIKDILIISTEQMLPLYKKLLENAHLLNLNIVFEIQKDPKGIAEAFIIGADFIGNDNVCLILGDNIFYGINFIFRENTIQNPNTIFGLYVKEPEKYGVINFSTENKVIEIIEKPQNYISNYAIPGIYHYDCDVVNIAKKLKPSARNELEITDINNILLKENKLDVVMLGRDVVWFDCGDSKSLLDASNFIFSIEDRHGIKVGCYEESIYNAGFVNTEQMLKYIETLPNCNYKNYLVNIFQKNNIVNRPYTMFS